MQKKTLTNQEIREFAAEQVRKVMENEARGIFPPRGDELARYAMASQRKILNEQLQKGGTLYYFDRDGNYIKETLKEGKKILRAKAV